VEKALVWRLSPSGVAASTYETPGGKVGFEGKLCHAILEASGQFEGGISFELYGSVEVMQANGVKLSFRTNDPKLDEVLKNGGQIVAQHDWSKVKGKFTVARGQPKNGKPGKEYVKPTWTQDDTFGLGVTVSGKLKNEAKPRVLHFDLSQAWPRNSTLWATAPDRQICYTAVRAYGNHVVPALMLGMPTEDDVTDIPDFARDPAGPRRGTREQLNAFAGETIDQTAGDPAAEEKLFDLFNADGVLVNRVPAAEWFRRVGAMMTADDVTTGDVADLWKANRQYAPKDNPAALEGLEELVAEARELAESEAKQRAAEIARDAGGEGVDAGQAADDSTIVDGQGGAVAEPEPERDAFWSGDLVVPLDAKIGFNAWIEAVIARAGEVTSTAEAAALDEANKRFWLRLKAQSPEKHTEARSRFTTAIGLSLAGNE
jgi:hypothetical protein